MDLWTEDDMYALAKRVHAHKRPSPLSLKALCLDFTIKKWKMWSDLNKQLGINPFNIIRKYFIRNFLYNAFI